MIGHHIPLDVPAAPAPCVVIDAQGEEVGVVVDYEEYIGLLDLLAACVEPRALPAYWRHAMEGYVGATAG